MKFKNAAFVAVTFLFIFALGLTTASAADYPSRPITLICPWGAGGGTDAVSRIIATLLKQDLGVPVNVVNRTGGSGAVGHTAMATARPDGYTIGMPTVEITMMHWMGLTQVTYKDMVPIAMVNFDPSGINVRTDSPWKTYKDLENYVRDNPGQLKDSGTGQGGIWHLAMAGWMNAIGLSPEAIKWIPSKGAAPALQDLMAGGIEMSTCSLPEAATLIDAGKVRPPSWPMREIPNSRTFRPSRKWGSTGPAAPGAGLPPRWEPLPKSWTCWKRPLPKSLKVMTSLNS
jgi:tripartite-type tricarboxylate transporter receptor subunit TctC